MRCKKCIHYDVCYQYDIIGEDDNEMCALYDKQRPHGEWIETSNIWETEDLSGWGYWKECSSCHCQEKRRTSFCPNCGADMRKEGEAE